MTPEAQRALLASIDAWHAKYEATDPLDALCGSDECPLCRKYYDCTGCPIERAAGQKGCGGTPFADAYDARWEWMCASRSNRIGTGASLYDVEFTRGQFRYHARKMIVFMKRLVPREAWMGVR